MPSSRWPEQLSFRATLNAAYGVFKNRGRLSILIKGADKGADPVMGVAFRQTAQTRLLLSRTLTPDP